MGFWQWMEDTIEMKVKLPEIEEEDQYNGWIDQLRGTWILAVCRGLLKAGTPRRGVRLRQSYPGRLPDSESGSLPSQIHWPRLCINRSNRIMSHLAPVSFLKPDIIILLTRILGSIPETPSIVSNRV